MRPHLPAPCRPRRRRWHTPQSEQDFETVKAAAVRGHAEALRAAATPPLPNHLVHERRLTRVLERGLPADHPHYATAQKRLAVLQSNPGWSQERKMVFAKRLVKRLVAAKQ